MAGAARILGRPHRVEGVVVHGDHRGRELGYPTANLDPHPTGVVPADGVYAGWLVRPALPDGDGRRRLPAAISIGTNPTFDGTERRVEAYVLDRTDLELYGVEVGAMGPTLLGVYGGTQPWDLRKGLRRCLLGGSGTAGVRIGSVDELHECLQSEHFGHCPRAAAARYGATRPLALKAAWVSGISPAQAASMRSPTISISRCGKDGHLGQLVLGAQAEEVHQRARVAGGVHRGEQADGERGPGHLTGHPGREHLLVGGVRLRVDSSIGRRRRACAARACRPRTRTSRAGPAAPACGPPGHVEDRLQLAVAAGLLVVRPPTRWRMNSRKTKIGALTKKVIELCSNGLPWRSRIR